MSNSNYDIGQIDDSNAILVSGEKEEIIEDFVSRHVPHFGTTISNVNNDHKAVVADHGPLGLKLTRTPYFMNSFSSKVQSSTDKKFEKSDSIPYPKTSTTIKPQSLKASNFPMKCIKIGGWQRISRYEGELVAKFYYARKKIIWEFINGPLKNKIEIPWSDIGAIKVVSDDNHHEILVIELNNPPTFFKEIDPQPRKHSLWEPWIDFTENHASVTRRHCVYFATTVLDKHYERLLERDPRLFELNQRPLPSGQSPFFNSYMARIPRNIPHNLNRLGSTVSPVMQHSNPTKIFTNEIPTILQYPNPNPNPTSVANGEVSRMVQYPNPNPNPFTRYPNNPTTKAPNQVLIRPPLIDTNGRAVLNYQVMTKRPQERMNFPGQNSNFMQGQSRLASENCNSNYQVESSDIENLLL